MRMIFSVLILMSALLISAADVYAMAGGGHGRGGQSSSASSWGGDSASVPEPSTIYALSSGLTLLGGAGYYLRRRKK